MKTNELSIVSELNESIRDFIKTENRNPRIILMGSFISIEFIKEMITVHRNYSIMESKTWAGIKIVTTSDIGNDKIEIY